MTANDLFESMSQTRTSWVAVSEPVGGGEPFEQLGRLGPLSLAWDDPASGTSACAAGVCAAIDLPAGELAGGLQRLLEHTVEFEGPRPTVGPWFGGFAFDGARVPQGEWAQFGVGRFVLPRWMIGRFGTETRLFAFEATSEAARASLRTARARLGAAEDGALVTARARANRDAWNRRITLALEAIARGTLSKVVLARELEVDASRPFELNPVLARARSSASTAFLCRGRDGAAFVGASPELLCRIEGATLFTHALASSAPSDAEDLLAQGDKERREHDAVIESIRSSLGDVCDSIEVDGAPQLLKLPYITHLKTPVRARLRAGVSPARAVAALHPTAAVNGTPRTTALDFLRTHEGFERGWYAGGVGWFGELGIDLRVALRSALIVGDRARVFVGAGIVRGSDAAAEWKETELKSRPMLRALGVEGVDG